MKVYIFKFRLIGVRGLKYFVEVVQKFVFLGNFFMVKND